MDVLSRGLCAAVAGLWLASSASADSGALLTSKSFTIGTSANSDMINSDGTSWAGGAVGVQGASSFNPLVVPSNHPQAANVSFKYAVGSVVESLNTTYGSGNWTIANAKLTFQYTLYANNNRFGGGPGNFDIYWVGNDNWTQGTNNPVFAPTGAGLAAWSGSQALLDSAYYSWTTPTYTGTTSDTAVWTTDKTGSRQSTISYNLSPSSSFVSDITSAKTSSNPNVSLYLMATSPTTGLTIFTGGGSSLPTLSFDVVTVPEPATLALLGLGGMVGLRRKALRQSNLAE